MIKVYNKKTAIRESVNDYVSYEYVFNNTNFKMNDVPCYSKHTTYNAVAPLNKCIFTLLPNKKRHLECMTFDLFNEWINLCRINGLVTKNAIICQEAIGNVLKVDGTTNSIKRMFSTLCCYRWADTYPKLCIDIINLLKHNSWLHFYQAFNYSLSTNNSQAGHSFCDIFNSSYSTKSYLPVYNAVMARFFLSDFVDNIAQEPDNNATLVATHINNYFAIVNNKIGRTLKFTKLQSMLHPCLTKMYDANFPIDDANEVIPLFEKAEKEEIVLTEET